MTHPVMHIAELTHLLRELMPIVDRGYGLIAHGKELDRSAVINNVIAFMQDRVRRGQTPPLDPIEFVREFAKDQLAKVSGDSVFLVAIDGMCDYLAQKSVDPLTGGLPKPFAFSATALAHLCAYSTSIAEKTQDGQRQGYPVAVIENDFFNMGNTNNYFHDLLAQGRGVVMSEVPAAEAQGLTDRVARLLMAEALQIIIERNGIKPVDVRSGGDEARILIPGFANADEAYADLHSAIGEMVEARMAALGLYAHAYGKDPASPRRGFGLGSAIADMRHMETSDRFARLDEHIKHNKDMIAGWRNCPEAQAMAKQLQEENGTGPDTPAPERLRNTLALLAQFEAEAVPRKQALFNDAAQGRTDAERLVIRHVVDALKTGGPATPNFDWITHGHEIVIDRFLRDMQALPERDSPVRRILAFVLQALEPRDPVTDTWTPDVVAACLELFLQKGKSENVPCYMMCFSAHGLAAVNEFSQEAGNEFLRFLRNVITDRMAKLGRHHGLEYQIAHYGGGEFVIIMRPNSNAGEENIDFAFLMQSIRNTLHTKDDVSISDFFTQRGLRFSHLKKEHGLLTFADLPDSKKKRGVPGIQMCGAMMVFTPGHTSAYMAEDLVMVLRAEGAAEMERWRAEQVAARTSARPEHIPG